MRVSVKIISAFILFSLIGGGTYILLRPLHPERELIGDTHVDWEKWRALAYPQYGEFSHVPISSGNIYPRLDFTTVPKFPCKDAVQTLASCIVDELLKQAPVTTGRTSYIDFVSQYASKYAKPSSFQIMVDELKGTPGPWKTSAVLAQAAAGDIQGAIATLKSMTKEKYIYPEDQTPPFIVTANLLYRAKELDKAMAFITASQSIRFQIYPIKNSTLRGDKGYLYAVMKDLINAGREKDAEQFAESITVDNIFDPRKSGREILGELRENVDAFRKKNLHLLNEIPKNIGGTTIESFKKSKDAVFGKLGPLRDAGLLNEVRVILKDIPVVMPVQVRSNFSAPASLYYLFNFAGLDDRANEFAQQAFDSGIMILEYGYDRLAKTAETGNDKTITDFLDRSKTEAERGYQAAIIFRSLLKFNSSFSQAEKLWPYAIGWCLQRNLSADMGRPITGFFHDEDRPNTYPACLIQLLPNYSFVYSLRGH